MLKSWSLQNFKAILDSGELKLAPVTVLAGRNSSGKSSLIQSILMIAQTLSNRTLDRALLPNGLIVQLGTFEDTLSEQTNLRTLVVGFTLEMGKEEAVKITSQFRSASSNGKSTSAIEASKVNVESVVVESLLAKSSKSEKKTEALEAVGNNTYVEYLGEAGEQTTQFFTSKIRYLGPLRADPQASQKFAPSSELDDVGAKGEYATAVYHANQNAVIQWYNPYTESTEENKLNIALNTWVRYLGVANEVRTQEAGLSGVSWLVVHMEGRKALPLPAVGVGISQILPILVMGLLAPSNTFLIVEQPEWYLHPSVQARLGDFFMGLAKCSKQCLIETHSENIVSQLRLHIVEAGGQEKADCMIYFADQDEQGAAQFHSIEISPRGNILNWPDGFFDETMLQDDRITAKVLKKRTNKG